MAFTVIQGTPAEIYLTFTPSNGTSATQVYLGGAQGKVILAALQSKFGTNAMLSSILNGLSTFFQTPLDVEFSNLIQSNSMVLSSQAIAQLQAAFPNAHNISVTVPHSGTLSAQAVNSISPGIASLLPPGTGTTGTELVLSYLLQGLSISFRLAIAGNPALRVTFDGLLNLIFGIPSSTLIAPVMQASLTPRNFAVSGLNFEGIIIATAINVFHLPIPFPTTPVSAPISQLSGFVNEVAQGVALAASFGFLQISAEVDPNPSGAQGTVPGPTVAVLLGHNWDPPPTIQNAFAGPGGLINPLLTPPLVSASIGGPPATVYGAGFPPPQSTQLAIQWNDTTSGYVTQSDIQWGELFGPPPVGGASAPSVIQTITTARNGPNDGANNFTATGLTPNTWYAFRVRDYDVASFIATQWSAWTAFSTSASDEVQLVINYNGADYVLGTTTLTNTGGFSGSNGSTSIQVVDPATPIGQTVLSAVLSSLRVAQTTLDVSAEGAPAIATLTVADPATGQPVPGTPNLQPFQNFELLGANFSAGPPITITIDGTQTLGSTNADSTGAFTASFGWPNGVYGLHSVIAQQGGVQVPAPVIGLYPIQ